MQTTSVKRLEGENIGYVVVQWTLLLIQNTVWDVLACLVFAVSKQSEKL